MDGWLTKVEGPNGFVEEYAYDPIGRKYRIITTEDTESTERHFVYDGGSIVLELEKDGDDYLLEKEHVRGLSLGGGIGGLLYTRDANGTTGYFHYDGQGNVVSITDDSREEVAYYEYNAWGNVLTQCGSLANEFAFSTKQVSLGTGLIDFGYRHYDPSIGRWTQRDPIGIAGGVNLYAYAAGAPTVFGDSHGLGHIPWGYEYQDGGDIPGMAAGSSKLETNPLSDKFSEWGAAYEGFNDQIEEDAEAARDLACQFICESWESFTRWGDPTYEGPSFVRYLSRGFDRIRREYGGAVAAAWLFGKLTGPTWVLEGLVGVDLGTGQLLSGNQRFLYVVGGTVQTGLTAYGASLARRAIFGQGKPGYSSRVWKRAAQAGDSYHNFPTSFDDIILQGERTAVAPGYTLYTRRGFINGRPGTYEIGVRTSGGTRTIDHRFFRPD